MKWNWTKSLNFIFTAISLPLLGQKRQTFDLRALVFVENLDRGQFIVFKDRDKNTSTQEKQPLCKSSCQMTWYLLPCDAIFKPTFSRQMDAAYKMYIHCSTQNGKDVLIAASRSSCPCLVWSGWKEGGLLPFLSYLSIEDTKAHHPTRTTHIF